MSNINKEIDNYDYTAADLAEKNSNYATVEISFDELLEQRYKMLNTAFKINYEQLKVLTQNIVVTNQENYDYDAESYAESLLEKSAKTRNLNFKNMRRIIDLDFKYLKNFLYSEGFDKDIFQNFVNTFFSVYDLDKQNNEILLEYPVKNNEPKEKTLLRNNYLYYGEFLEFYIGLNAVDKITRALEGDFTTSGYKSIFYDRPDIDGLVKVEGKFIDDLIEYSDKIVSASNKTFKKEKHKLKNKLYNESLEAKINSFDRSRVEHYNFFERMYIDRINAVNTTFIKKSIDRANSIFDRMLGIPANIGDIKKDWTYMTREELAYLRFLLIEAKADPEKVNSLFEQFTSSVLENQRI